MESEKQLLKKASDALEKSAEIFIDNRKISAAETAADFYLTYEAPSGKTKHIVVEVKRKVNNAIISQLSIRKDELNEPLTLVSEYISTFYAEKLRDLNIQFFDTAGNAFLREKNLYIFIIGNKIKTSKDPPLGVFRPAGIKLILAFVSQPGLENEDYRTIEAETGVPKSSVGRIMKDLEAENFLVKRGNTERILRDKKTLIERWVQYYSEKFRPKLKPIRFRATKTDQLDNANNIGRWWNEIDIAEFSGCWGGETGGARLTNYLRPQIATIYTNSNLNLLKARYGLVRDQSGELEILEKFWKQNESSLAIEQTNNNVAPPLVVYADLIDTADERNIETAKIVYDQYLADFTESDSW